MRRELYLASFIVFAIGVLLTFLHLYSRKEQLRQRNAIETELVKDVSEAAEPPQVSAPDGPLHRNSRLVETDEEILVQFYDVDVMKEASYPEYEAVKHKPNVGICLSGGGTRSFEASLGYLRALLDADLLKYVRYMSSVSGGSWANAVFTYHDEETLTLDELLGKYTPPEETSLLGLRSIPQKSARGYPVKTNLISVVLGELIVKGTPIEDLWVKAIHETFLKKAGIAMGDVPAWDRKHVTKTLAQNPELLNDIQFRVPCAGRKEKCDNIPFPIMNNAMLGPIEAAPFGLYQRRYVMMESTPLYVGFPRLQNVTYPNNIHLSLGGLVEPLGFGSVISNKNFCGLAQCSSPTLRRIPKPYKPFSIANATAASSWAPGALVAEQPLLKPLDNVLLTAAYYSPYYGGPTREVFVGDGANLENQGLIALLQRDVRRIVMFINSPIPLNDRNGYHPYLRPPLYDVDIDSSITALFGLYNLLPPFGMDFSHDQVFHKRDFPRVVAALQDSQKEGRGAVAAVDLLTIENKWWGIAAGKKVHVVFAYLGRVYEWESKLTNEVADVVAPHRLTKKSNLLPKEGLFKDFPHFSTTKLHFEASQANALADMSAWVVKRNLNIFKKALKPSWWELHEQELERGITIGQNEEYTKYSLDWLEGKEQASERENVVDIDEKLTDFDPLKKALN